MDYVIAAKQWKMLNSLLKPVPPKERELPLDILEVPISTILSRIFKSGITQPDILFQLAEAGCVEVLKFIDQYDHLKDIFITNPHDHAQKTLAHVASNVETLSYVLDRMKKQNEEKIPTDHYGDTPGHVAALIDNPDLLKVFIKAYGVEKVLQHKGGSKDTVMHVAAAENSIKVATLLVTEYYEAIKDIRYDLTPGYTPLFEAIETGSREVALLLIQHNLYVHDEVGGSERRSLVNLALRNGEIQAAAALMHRGYKRTFKNLGTRGTPLYVAVESEDLATVKYVVLKYTEEIENIAKKKGIPPKENDHAYFTNKDNHLFSLLEKQEDFKAAFELAKNKHYLDIIEAFKQWEQDPKTNFFVASDAAEAPSAKKPRLCTDNTRRKREIGVHCIDTEEMQVPTEAEKEQFKELLKTQINPAIKVAFDSFTKEDQPHPLPGNELQALGHRLNEHYMQFLLMQHLAEGNGLGLAWDALNLKGLPKIQQYTLKGIQQLKTMAGGKGTRFITFAEPITGEIIGNFFAESVT